MIRFLCGLFVVILCGCATHHQSDTFKEKYNVYAEPEIVDVESGYYSLPVEWASPYPAEAFMFCDVPTNELADFVDAIVRRMDAENLPEYLAIQNQIDTLFRRLRVSICYQRGKEKYGNFGNPVFLEERARRALFGYYMTRDENGIRNAVATVQYTRYLIRNWK